MESLVMSLITLTLALIIAAIVMAVLAFRRTGNVLRQFDALSTRVNRLEAQSGRTPGQPSESAPATPKPASPAGAPSPSRPTDSSVVSDRPLTPASVARAPASTTTTPRPPVPSDDAWQAEAAGPALEETVGARVFVWLGAIALALAGTFLVKYLFDKGWLSPTVRLVCGGLFGAALLAAGEWMRSRSMHVAQGLSAAGVAALFAVVWAAVNLYHLVTPTLGLGLMAAVTALAVVLSLRQGVMVATLGLVGGFLTPVLVRMGEVHLGLFAYLFVLQLGLLAVTRRRRWAPLTMLTLLFAMGWAGWWLLSVFELQHTAWIGLFLVGTVASMALTANVGGTDQVWGRRSIATVLTWASAASGMIGVGGLVWAADFTPTSWMFLAVLGAGCLVLARVKADYQGLAPLASGFGIALLLAWSAVGSDIEVAGLGLATLSLGALYAIGCYICLWGSACPWRWAALSAVSCIAYVLVGYFCLDGPPQPLSWGGVCLILAGLYVLFALPVGRVRAKSREHELALAGLAVAVTAMVSLAVPMELERAWITVAWAIEIPLLGLIAWWLRVDALRIPSLILGGLVAVRLLLNPYIADYPIGIAPIVNWLLYGYGVPAVTMAVGAWVFNRRRDGLTIDLLACGSALIGLAMVTLQIRQYFHPADIAHRQVPLIEWATFSVAWLLYGWAVMTISRWVSRSWLCWCGRMTAGAAVLQSVVAQGLLANPLWNSEPVGATKICNWLLYIYALPAALMVPTLREFHRDKLTAAARAVGVAAMAMVFLLITLEVRQYFQGSLLDGFTPDNAEWYAYSVAWMAFAALLLVLGIVTGGVSLRYASLVVMLLAVGKVFLFDMRHLKDLYRVFSFFGLGVVLMVLAYLYHRFVFTRSAPTASDRPGRSRQQIPI